MSDELSIEVREAVVQVCGTAFHYKSTLRPVFTSAGVSGSTYDKYVAEGLGKFAICRAVLDELDRLGTNGRRAQHQIVEALAGMTKPMPDAPDQAAGIEALKDLRSVVGRQENTASTAGLAERRNRRDLLKRAQADQAEKTAAIQTQFVELSRADLRMTRQERGYALERLLRDLFNLEEIQWRSSYKVESVEQIDGAFKLDGLDYLVEARWRNVPPAANDLYAFAGKLATKLDSTRGLFITMCPPRPEVVQQLGLVSRRFIVLDGSDLAIIIQGLVSLRDALELKVAKAAQEGLLYYPLRDRAA